MTFSIRVMAMAALCAALAAPAPASEMEVGIEGVNRDSIGVMGIGRGKEPDVVVVASFQDAGGILAVCGAIISDTKNGTLRRAAGSMARQIKFLLNGERLKVRTANFNRFDSMDGLKAGKLGCSITTVPWQATYATTELTYGSNNFTYTDQ